jgi:hypothetical protein
MFFFNANWYGRSPFHIVSSVNYGVKRVRCQQSRFRPMWAAKSSGSRHELEFGERDALPATGRQPMGTESIRRAFLWPEMSLAVPRSKRHDRELLFDAGV